MKRFILISALIFSAPACKETPKPAEKPAEMKKPVTPDTAERTPGAHDKEEERDQAAVSDPLQIIVDGKPAGEWTMEKMKAVKTGSVAGAGESGKEGWSLHTLATELVGPKARV